MATQGLFADNNTVSLEQAIHTLCVPTFMNLVNVNHASGQVSVSWALTLTRISGRIDGFLRNKVWRTLSGFAQPPDSVN